MSLVSSSMAQAFAARCTRSFTSCSVAFSSSQSPRPPSPQGNRLRMIMFGKPGAGKGTLTSRLVAKYDLMALSSGDMLRQHIAESTEVGRIVEDLTANGQLVPDDLMIKVVTAKLDELRFKHWILDGFPRTVGQGELLDAHLASQDMALSLIINLDVEDQVILSRISDRWVHLPSGRVYNMSYNRPKVDGRDDVTGEPLSKRPDDNPEIFARRLKQYYASTEPLITYFTSRSPSSAKLVSLKGKTSDEIWPQLDDVVRGLFPHLQPRAPEPKTTKKRTSLSEALLGRQQTAKAWVPPVRS